ncbi:MAG: FixH family protein [Methylotenera sp.]|uniref:FixH family protein n=1 Tax=Methylotenera sp. TaxID=2051956 RepID=UPI002487C05D|nr:FixH family protein [Methylotenera sp.]MDI1308364.1 FixH family protein [Methylotenera sp.]
MEKLDTKPWWHFGYVWLIIAGPLLVVIASFITLYLAVTRPDAVIDDYYRKGMEINKTLSADRDGMAPAMQARNHAATGLKPIENQ